MRAILVALAAAVLILAGCTSGEAPPPPQPALAPPFPAPLIGPAPPPLPYAEPVRPRRYAAKHYAPKCQIRTHTTVNKAGVKRTARYRVCLK